jgi:hypothetical protein
MTFHIPIRMSVLRRGILGAADFDLLETPLGQDGVSGSNVTPKDLMAES